MRADPKQRKAEKRAAAAKADAFLAKQKQKRRALRKKYAAIDQAVRDKRNGVCHPSCG